MYPMPKEQLDYIEDEYGGPEKMQYYGGGAISTLEDDELIGEDDEYDELYGDVNVGEGFLQFQRSEASGPSANGTVIIAGFQTQKESQAILLQSVQKYPMPKEKLDYKEEEYGGPKKMQHYGGAAVSALAEDELIGEDDEYDELYGDVNVGEGFLKFQRSEAPGPSANGAVNAGFQTQKESQRQVEQISQATLLQSIKMDPVPEEELDYEEEEYGGPKKMQCYGGGAISALAENEMIGEDDEYDDLYGDLIVGEGFLQFQQSEAPGPSANGAVNGGFQTQKTTVPEPRPVNLVPKESNIYGVQTDEKYKDAGVQLPEPDPYDQITAEMVPNIGAINASQKAIAPDLNHNSQVLNFGFRAHNTGIDPVDMLSKVANESVPLLNPKTSVQHAVSQLPPKHSNYNVNMSCQIANDNPIRPTGDNGPTMLIVGELHWWTTDAEIESVSSKYGRVKEIKFIDEKANGKSKGYCQVEFYDSAAAAKCKEGMNGYNFDERSCTVEFASPHTLRQTGASYMNKSQVQPQSQSLPQGKRLMNDNADRGGRTNYPTGDSGRCYGRGEWARGQGGGHRGGGHMRGIGGSVGPKNMPNSPSVGAGANSRNNGQGLGGPAFGGFMHPQGMMVDGFDPTYMGRGSGYKGFEGPSFPRMIPNFPNVNAMGNSGVSPHVNPAFYEKGMSANGMGMTGNAGMDGPHSGMWNDINMGGLGPEEHGQRKKESSYSGEEGGSEYEYGESSHDKGLKSSSVSREKERASKRDWSVNSCKRHHHERDHDRKRYDRERHDKERYDRERHDKERYDRRRYDRGRYNREHRYRQETDDYLNHRHKYHALAYKDDRQRGQTSPRSRRRSLIMEDHRSRSRDVEYWKRSACRRTNAF